ncbi:MAG TPA: PrsW family glutamic-type intramembrane protease [Aggregatilineaceae bacterium]|nr:PrsW family glutamic-type intramembrane protease [Aggregatilineaceae bacterium]
MVAGIVIAVAVPLGFLYIVWMLDIYALSDADVLVTSIGWGGVAFSGALIVQTGLMRANALDFTQVTFYSAPVLEELLKALLLLALASRLRLLHALDGMAYGFAIGTGFALSENLLYVGSNPHAALATALARVLSVSLMHAYTTAIVGTVVGGSLHLPDVTRLTRTFATLGLAMFLHGMFNRLVAMMDQVWRLPLAMVIGLSGTGLIIFLLEYMLRSDVLAGVWRQVTMLRRKDTIALNPVEVSRVFSDYTAEDELRCAGLIDQYVALQARCSILRQALRVQQQPEVKGSLVQQLSIVERQLALLRHRMLSYTWFWLNTDVSAVDDHAWAQAHEVGREPLAQRSLSLAGRGGSTA